MLLQPGSQGLIGRRMGIQILQTAFTARRILLTSSTAVAVTGATLDLDINYGGVLLASDSMSIEVNVLFTNCTVGLYT